MAGSTFPNLSIFFKTFTQNKRINVIEIIVEMELWDNIFTGINSINEGKSNLFTTIELYFYF